MRDAVVLKLPEDRYQEALRQPGAEPFTMPRPSGRGLPFGRWAQFPANDIEAVTPWLRTAYQHVASEPPRTRRKRRPGPLTDGQR